MQRRRPMNRRTELHFCQLEAREVPASGPNLLLNPSVETAATASRPANWQTGKWGSNTATFSYLNTGIDGTRSLRVDMTSRSTGDAKWYSDDVQVTPGATYTFTNQSLSNVATILTLRYTLANGSYQYSGNQVVAASPTTPQTNSYTFTAPANAKSVTVFHIIQSVGYLTTDNFSLALQTPNADTTPPSVNVTSHTNNATVAGTINLGANATDNLGVAGVQFRIDGNLVGTEDTTAPYSMSFNTATLTNGTHTLTATARDTSGNVTTSAPISLIVANSVPDTTAPSVAVIGPGNNATVLGTVTLTAAASDNIGVTSVQFRVDGNLVGTPITTTPYSYAFDTTTLTNGTHTITAVAYDAANNTTTSTPVTITVANVIIDTTAPTVSVTAPTANTSLSGSVLLSANASDNVGVTFVRFYVDGVAVGSNITSAPYNYTLSTNSLTNGIHSITAVAVDAAGNSQTSAPVSVTVANSTSPNLIANPSFETAGTGGNPANWNRGTWGVNTSVYTYPIAGFVGNNAARVEVTSYTSGDAKWMFNAVPVTAGSTYTFSNNYRSNTPTQLVIEYQMTGGSLQYIYVATVAASTTWASTNYNITVPAGATAMTMFHLVASVGFLEVDNYSLTATTVPPPPPTNGALVSFTFDDGWNSQWTNALPILTAANIPATFYVNSNSVLDAQQYELVRNPSLENNGTGGNPANWNRRTTGTNDATFTYPVAGKVGDDAAKVEVTSYTNGEAAWSYQNVSVIPGRQYSLSNQYNSTATTTLAVQYTNSNNTTTLVDLRTLTATNGNWNSVFDTITIPSGVTSLTVMQLLRGVGSVTVDDFSLRLVANTTDYSYMGAAQIRSLETLGHEIGGHTRDHTSLISVSQAVATDQVAGDRTALLNMGLKQVDTFAYPYGDYNTNAQQIVANSGYLAARTVEDGFNTGSTNRYALTTVAVERATPMANIKASIDEAIAQGSWVTLMFHRIDGDPTDIYGCTVQTLQEITNYVKSKAIEAVTVREGLHRVGLA